jgi:type IV pilus assembly protein PilN
MIRINLLGVERKPVRKAAAFDSAQQLTVVCSLILVAAFAGIGWWYWTLDNESVQLDAQIASRTAEAARLQSLIADVQTFDGQRKQLQERVALIEQLRSGQNIPVQLLDHVSKSLPDMMWLTDVEQKGSAVTIKGESTTLIALSDFVGNLADGGLLKKPIEIVDSQVDSARAAGPRAAELIKFTVKAELASSGRAAGAAGGPGTTPPGR